MENSAEYYYEKLKTADKPGVVLATFYCSLYNLDVSKSEIIMFNKLIRTFSRFVVYFGILDTFGSKSMKPPEEPFPYIYEVCKRRFETVHVDSTIQSREPLDKCIAALNERVEEIEEIKSKKKFKIPSSEGLE